MKRRRIFKWIILLFIALIPIIGIYAFNNPKAFVETFVDLGGFKKGDDFPMISGQEVDGEIINLKEFKGEKFIAMMSKSDCDVCKSTYPTLSKWQEKYPDIPFVMLGVGNQGEYQKVKQEQNFQFPIIDANEKIQSEMEMKIFPVFYAVDKNGSIIKRLNGFNDKEFNNLIQEVRENE